MSAIFNIVNNPREVIILYGENQNMVIVLRNIYYIVEKIVDKLTGKTNQFNPRLFISVFLHKPYINKTSGRFLRKQAQAIPHHFQGQHL
jgi:hypothetical protein